MTADHLFCQKVILLHNHGQILLPDRIILCGRSHYRLNGDLLKAQIGQMQTDFMREVNSFQTRMDAFTKAYVDNTNISTNALHKVSEELKASGENLLTAHKAFSKGVNGELQHAFGMFDANMQDIIDKLTGIINSISASVKDMPAIMTDTANAYEDQLRQLTRYMEHMQRLLEDGMRRAGRGGGQ